MPTKESMEDLTWVCNRLEETIRIAETGEIPIDAPNDVRLTPFVLGNLLELTRQLAYHVKSLQIEVAGCQQQTTSLPL